VNVKSDLLIIYFKVQSRSGGIRYIKSLVSKRGCSLQHNDSYLMVWLDITDVAVLQSHKKK
jgi:hypothetical protein